MFVVQRSIAYHNNNIAICEAKQHSSKNKNMDGFVNSIRKNKFVSRGGPLIVLCVAGSLILRQFSNIR